jgi:bacteriocin-like protein
MSTSIDIAANKSKHDAAMAVEQPNMHGNYELSDDEMQAINGGACVMPESINCPVGRFTRLQVMGVVLVVLRVRCRWCR